MQYDGGLIRCATHMQIDLYTTIPAPPTYPPHHNSRSTSTTFRCRWKEDMHERTRPDAGDCGGVYNMPFEGAQWPDASAGGLYASSIGALFACLCLCHVL